MDKSGLLTRHVTRWPQEVIAVNCSCFMPVIFLRGVRAAPFGNEVERQLSDLAPPTPVVLFLVQYAVLTEYLVF